MKASKSFLAAVRTLAVQRLKTNDSLWAIYQQRRSRSGCFAIFVVALAFVGLLTALIALPFSTGVEVGNGGRDVPLAGIVAVMIATALTIGHARWLLQELASSQALAVASQLPIPDSEVVQHRLRHMRLLGAAALAISLAFFSGVAQGAKLPLREAIVVIAMGLIEWSVMRASWLILPTYFPQMQERKKRNLFWGFCSMALAVGVVATSNRWIRAETLLKVTLGVLPTGWPMLMVGYGVIGRRPAVFLLMIPVALLWLWAWFAVRRMVGRYVIAEIDLNDSRFAAAVLQLPDHESSAVAWTSSPSDSPVADALPDETNNQRDDEPRPNPIVPHEADFGWNQNQLSDDESRWNRNLQVTSIWQRLWWRIKSRLFAQSSEPDDPLTPDECRELVRTRMFLTMNPVESRGWVESSVLNVADDRERMLVDVATASTPGWSKRLLEAVVIALLLIAPTIFPPVKGPIAAIFFGMSFFCLPLILSRAFTDMWPAWKWKSRTDQSIYIFGALPISPREMTQLTVKMGVIRAGYLSLFVFCMTAMYLHLARERWDFVRAAIIAAKFTVLIAAIHQWNVLTWIHFAFNISWKWFHATILVVFVTMLGAIIGIMTMVLARDSEIKSLLGFLLVWASGWALQRFMVAAVNRSDWITVTKEVSTLIRQNAPELKW